MSNEEYPERLAVRVRTASILATLRKILGELCALPETDRRKALIISNRSMITVLERLLSSVDAELRAYERDQRCPTSAPHDLIGRYSQVLAGTAW
jgi:hypothetical protein